MFFFLLLKDKETTEESFKVIFRWTILESLVVSLLCYWDDFGGAQAEGGAPGVHQRITAPGLFFHGGTIDILV
jgi:hypothetical protein